MTKTVASRPHPRTLTARRKASQVRILSPNNQTEVPEDADDAEAKTFEMTGEKLRTRLMANFGEFAELDLIMASDTFQVPMGLLGGDDD